MTKEDALHLQIKTRFTDYLKAAQLPYWEPALTTCPHCGEHAGILMDYMWHCQHCNKRGDVVDYVMALEHLDSRLAAIKRVCRVLQIKITTLEVISANELMDKEFEQSNTLIEGLIGRGVYLIAGSPKIGKSWLMLWMAHCISTGEKVWEFSTRQCEVLYISLEDPEQRIQERLAKVTGGETGNILFATEAEIMGKGFEEQVIGFLGEHPAVKFIIVDTLQKVRQLRADQYSYAGDYEVISQMKSIADRFGITILLVHHTRKTGASDPFALISGTTGLSGGVDGALVMIKADRQDNLATLYATGRDTLDMELQLMFDETTSTWQFLGYGEKSRRKKRERLLCEINGLLEDIGSFHGTASELMEQLVSRSDIQIKSANALTRQINPYKSLLQQEYGIRCEVERTSKERIIHLTKIADDGNDDIVSPPADTVITVIEENPGDEIREETQNCVA